MLYVVATPIGNLEDMTFRAVRTLKEVDFVIAEDTRVSGFLLKHFEIDKPMKSFHSYSSGAKVEQLVDDLAGGKSAALISDAGTPGVSDPGFKLVQQAVKADVEVVPIPGASAVVAALSVSGAPMDKFVFIGFLPVKKGRQTMLESLKDEKRTIVLYESVHRISKTLDNLYTALGDRYVCVGREMTKKFEEYWRGSLLEAKEYFSQGKQKGEFTIVVAPETYNF